VNVASSRLLTIWDGVKPGTIVTLRRCALSGEKAERTKAWTKTGPHLSDTGIACIGVEVGGVVVSYPLDRVSLGWTEPPLTIASTLDPVPAPIAPTIDHFVSLAIGLACLYFVGIGGLGLLGWLFR
jgi:hypothetical protein